MDANKLKQLHLQNYTIPTTCGICKHGQFKPKTDFGTCNIITYNHQKHSESKRHLSIYVGGRCKDHFELDNNKITHLGTYGEFIKT